jgi:hypothetical protein
MRTVWANSAAIVQEASDAATVRVARCSEPSPLAGPGRGVDKVISLVGRPRPAEPGWWRSPRPSFPATRVDLVSTPPAAGMRFVPRYLTTSMTRDGAENRPDPPGCGTA